MTEYIYHCLYMANRSVPHWEEVAGVPLTDVLTGETPRLGTTVKICRTDSSVHVRFECADDHIVATYTNRDDPIFKEDAVEIFIDECGDGRFYKEIELSPRNVIFDALIDKEEGEVQKVNTSWDMNGLITNVTWTDASHAVYDMVLPVSAFDKAPTAGTVWRINMYRIDNDATGGRHYWAWSPTRVRRNFHVPSKFGMLIFY